MAINGSVRPAYGADTDLDIPDFLKPDYAPDKDPQVIIGEVVQPDETPVVDQPEDDEDDIAPGVLEVRPYRPPVLHRTGSAAMVVASRAGRAVGLSARGTWTASRWFGHGTRSASVLGYRYVRALDHQEALGGMNGPGWRKVLDTRYRRWKFLGFATGGLVGVDLAAWWALVKFAGMTALDLSWAVAPGIETLAAGALLTLYGRYRLEAGLAPGQIVDPQDDDADPDEPFPLAWCKDGEQVAECVSRALAHEGINTRRIDILGHHSWGWEIDIDLKGSKAAKVNAAAEELDTHFNIKQGGTLIETDPKQSAHIVLRLVTNNPFENLPLPTPHAPNSLDIGDPHPVALCMDGRTFAPVLEGTRILVIGVSGAAKSTGVLRDLAEIITACHNAIALDLDPVKDGLREFEGVMAVPPIRGNEECEKWLAYLVRMAQARNVVRNQLRMGDTWVATATHPAIFPIVDEFIYLSQKAKESFIELLRLGKQAAIYPIAAGQDATSDSLGDAIADSFTLSIMLASRFDDIRLVLGAGSGAKGYRPDRLVPAQTKEIRNDAGQSYIKGAGADRPLLYGWYEHTRDGIDRAVAERQAAGRPWFDDDTLAAADLLHVIARPGATPAATVTVADRLDALAQQGGIEDAAHVAVLLREFELAGATFLPTSEVLLPALRNVGANLDADKLARLLRRHAPGVTSDREEWKGSDGRLRGWSRSAIEQAAAGLIDPAKARREAG